MNRTWLQLNCRHEISQIFIWIETFLTQEKPHYHYSKIQSFRHLSTFSDFFFSWQYHPWNCHLSWPLNVWIKKITQCGKCMQSDSDQILLSLKIRTQWIEMWCGGGLQLLVLWYRYTLVGFLWATFGQATRLEILAWDFLEFIEGSCWCQHWGMSFCGFIHHLKI